MDNNNRGALWTNTKRRGDRDPMWTGNAVVDGKEYWVSAWPGDKTNAKAPKVSFTFRAKESQNIQQPEQNDFEDSDIPF